MDLGLNQLLSIKSASYFTMRAVPAGLPAGRLLMRDVTAGVDQQMAALCVALFQRFFQCLLASNREMNIANGFFMKN